MTKMNKTCVLTQEQSPIFVRVHSRVKGEKKREEHETKARSKWANFALVFDCETTTDLREDLNFLWWRFCELKNGIYVCQREGVVHRDQVDAQAIGLIHEYAHGRPAEAEEGCPADIKVQSRTEFVNGELWNALRTGAVVVAFNEAFDISRLALAFPEARNKNSGWSMVMWKYKRKADKLRPKITIKPKDSRSAFINLAGGDPKNRLIYRGRFLDLSVLGWSLRNKHLDLDGFLASFGLPGKMKHDPTGRITTRELAYGRRDTKRTVQLLNAMKREYDGFPLSLPPERAMSAASITKAFLDEMCVERPAQKFTIPDNVLGKCMQSYYGGRSEIRIRHQEVPVVVCDTTSEYPSVAALLKLWPLLTATDIKIEDCTQEARATLQGISLQTSLDPRTWRELGFFASLKPNGDVLPIRAIYADTGNTNIGLNPLFSEKSIWYAGPDLAGSKLKTGKTPEIIRAFRLVPQGIQKGMKTTHIGSRMINPEKDDFFRAVIQERKMLPKTHPHYLLLKIIANALYGIFAELNKYEYGKNDAKEIQVFSGDDKFSQLSCIVERPGKRAFAPAAAQITAGGRLMLTILECMVEQLGGTYLLTDTDSMLFVASEKGGLIPCRGGQYKMPDGSPAIQAITWKQVREIARTLNSLNPYDPSIVGEILKVEDCNYDLAGKQHQLYGLSISAKRYVVYKRRKNNLEIIKPSEHGLGVVYVPDKRKRFTPQDCKDQETSYPRWIVEAWEQLLANHFRTTEQSDEALLTRNLSFGTLPAVMRIRVTTPNVMKALRKRDPGSAKPYNFALSPILLNNVPDCTLVAPFSKRPEEWLTRDYVEINSGDFVKLYSEHHGTKLIPQTLAGVLWRHYLHPEDKSLAPDGLRCGPYTSGLLLRRPIQAITPFRTIGKEIERSAQEGEDVSLLQNRGPVEYAPRQTIRTRAADAALILRAKRFPLRLLMRRSGLSQHAVERFLSTARVHPDTRARMETIVRLLEQEIRIQPKEGDRNK